MQKSSCCNMGSSKSKRRLLALTRLYPIIFFLLTLSINLTAHAETIAYDFVQDAVGDASSDGCLPADLVTDYCTIKNIPVLTGSTSANVEISAWESDSPSGYSLSGSAIYIGAPPIPEAKNDKDVLNDKDTFRVKQTEESLSQMLTYRDPAPETLGIYTRPFPLGSKGNSSINWRNLRVQFFNGEKRVAFNGPTQLTYTNIQDGDNLTSLPLVRAAKHASLGRGFQGTATGNAATKISEVYLSLQRSDGLYWGSPTLGWSHLHINLPAQLRVLDEAPHQIEWTRVGGWPTGSDLMNGQYTLRAMARVGRASGGAGLLNTIRFNVDDGSTPASTSYFRIKSNWESDTYLGDGGAYATYATKPAATDTLYQWEIMRVNGEYLRFKNRSTGDVLHIQKGDGNLECTPAPSSWQSSAWKEEDPQQGVMRFSNRQRPDQYIHIDDLMGVGQAGAISPQWKSALWQFEFVGTDTTPPQISTLAVPSAGGTVTEIHYLKGDCSDNIGGSGVKRVGVQFVRVDTINQSWNWEAQTWGPDDGADDKVKSAKFNPTGTSWTIEDQLPPPSELPDGKYRTVLTTYDFAGNPYSWTLHEFTLTKPKE